MSLRLDKLKSALGILLIERASGELTMDQVHKVQQVDLIRVMTVFEVVSDGRNILFAYLDKHVFLKCLA